MLILSPEFVETVVHPLVEWQHLPFVDERSVKATRAEALRHEALQQLGRLVVSVIEEQGFIQIRGVPSSEADKVFVTLASLIGTPFIDPATENAIVSAHVRPDEALMGNQLRLLPLHTDYSMLMHPPRLTMSLCLEPDPLPEGGSLLVSDVEAMCFGLESDPVFQRFFFVTLPFAGRNASDEIDVIQSPIMSHENGKFLVRFHRSRIRQGFRALNATPTAEQSSVILEFEQLVSQHVQTLTPEKGDITIIDNHRMLHARTRCSVIVMADGATRGRQMKFLFAY